MGGALPTYIPFVSAAESESESDGEQDVFKAMLGSGVERKRAQAKGDELSESFELENGNGDESSDDDDVYDDDDEDAYRATSAIRSMARRKRRQSSSATDADKRRRTGVTSDVIATGVVPVRNEKLYCLCKQPYNAAKFYVACDECDDWFHGKCVNVTELEAEQIDVYVCDACTLKGHRRTRYKSDSEESESVTRGNDIISVHNSNATISTSNAATSNAVATETAYVIGAGDVVLDDSVLFGNGVISVNEP